MNDERRPWTIRRILVALDASPHSLAALEAAIQMAMQSGAEVAGIFVEDVNLSRLAAMPFAREVCLISATSRQFDMECVERHLHAQATRIRHSLAGQAERASVRWSFHVARGSVAQEVLSAAADADVVVLGRSGSSLVRGRRLGSTARAVLSGAPRATMLVQQGTRIQAPFWVLYDGSPPSRRALAAAAGMVAETNERLTVLLPVADVDEAAALRDEIADWLRAREVSADYRVLSASNVSALVQMLRVQGQGKGTLILPASTSVLEIDAVSELLDETQVPVLIVR